MLVYISADLRILFKFHANYACTFIFTSVSALNPFGISFTETQIMSSEMSEGEQYLMLAMEELSKPGIIFFDARPLLKKIAFFIVAPAAILFHILVYLINFERTTFNLIIWKGVINKSNLVVVPFFWGLCIASIVFFIRFKTLKGIEMDAKKRIKDLTDKNTKLQSDLDKFKAAASNISVPYRLDTLVDKGLGGDILPQSSRLRALPTGI